MPFWNLSPVKLRTKTTNQQVVGTTLAAVTQLCFCVPACSVASFETTWLVTNVNAVGDIKFGVCGPACSTIQWNEKFFEAAVFGNCDTDAHALSCATTLLGHMGIITTGGTAGTFKFTFAENVACGCGVTVLKGSSMRWWNI